MKSRPEVTDKEIQEFMDFDKLLLESKGVIRQQKTLRIIRNSAAALAVLAIVATLIVQMTGEKTTADAKTTPEARHEGPVMDAPVAAEPSDLSVGTADRPNREKSENVTSPDPVTTDIRQPQGKDKPAGDVTVIQKKPVYVQAEPVDGYPALYDYFRRELQYPAEAIGDSIQGIVTVIFTIDTEGKPVNVQIENSLGSAFDKQVMIVIEKMPAWNPASYNDKPVSSKISLPLTFELNKLDPKN